MNIFHTSHSETVNILYNIIKIRPTAERQHNNANGFRKLSTADSKYINAFSTTADRKMC